MIGRMCMACFNYRKQAHYVRHYLEKERKDKGFNNLQKRDRQMQGTLYVIGLVKLCKIASNNLG